jgi:CMP-N,N'-diacetyllegionaminic acid synthase
MTRDADMRRILGLILARGGSKRMPGKNIRTLLGKPLIAWSIEASLACKAISRTVVSTDSGEIAAIAERFNADVPFIRPSGLAADHSTSADAALHALDALLEKENQEFDAVVLLEPTSPLRATGDLQGVANLLIEKWEKTDAVVTVGAVHLEQPQIIKVIDAEGYLSPWINPAAIGATPAFFPYGVAYAIKTSALRAHRSFYPPRVIGFPISRWQNYEVDDEFDFVCVEAILRRFEGKLP